MQLREHTFWTALLIGAAASASPPAQSAANDTAYDMWIRNGTIVDGTGGERAQKDVLILGDTIAVVADLDGMQVNARRTIDAAGKLVVPGFIDTHSHGDPLAESFTSFLYQGITTVVLGQDGATADLGADQSPTLAEWMREVDQHSSEVNVATLSGHGTLRMRAGVGNAPPLRDTGNIRLGRIVGARMTHIDTADDDVLEGASEQLTRELQSQGRRPFRMIMGGSTGRGALGYADAFDEIVRKELREALDAIVKEQATKHATTPEVQAAYEAVGRKVPHMNQITFLRTKPR